VGEGGEEEKRRGEQIRAGGRVLGWRRGKEGGRGVQKGGAIVVIRMQRQRRECV